jgi:hypothetical protein
VAFGWVFYQVYEGTWKNVKSNKKRSSKLFEQRFLEVGVRPKKGRLIFIAAPLPPFQISKYATEHISGAEGETQKCRKFAEFSVMHE